MVGACASALQLAYSDSVASMFLTTTVDYDVNLYGATKIFKSNMTAATYEVDTFESQGSGQQSMATLQRSSDYCLDGFIRIAFPALTIPPAPVGFEYTVANPAGWYTNAAACAYILDCQLQNGSCTLERTDGTIILARRQLLPVPAFLGEQIGYYNTTAALVAASQVPQLLYFPLSYGFSNEIGKALPLASSYTSNFQLQVNTRRVDDLLCTDAELVPQQGPGTGVFVKPVALATGQPPVLTMTLLLRNATVTPDQRARLNQSTFDYIWSGWTPMISQSVVIPWNTTALSRIALPFTQPTIALYIIAPDQRMTDPAMPCQQFAMWSGPDGTEGIEFYELTLDNQQRTMVTEAKEARTVYPLKQVGHKFWAYMYPIFFSLLQSLDTHSGSLDLGRPNDRTLVLTIGNYAIKYLTQENPPARNVIPRILANVYLFLTKMRGFFSLVFN